MSSKRNWLSDLLVSVLTIAFTFTANVKKSNIESIFDCKIKANSIIKIDGGKATTYAGSQDCLKVGDSITLRFGYLHHNGSDSELLFEILDSKRNKLIDLDLWDRVSIKKDYLDESYTFLMPKERFMLVDRVSRNISIGPGYIRVN